MYTYVYTHTHTCTTTTTVYHHSSCPQSIMVVKWVRDSVQSFPSLRERVVGCDLGIDLKATLKFVSSKIKLRELEWPMLQVHVHVHCRYNHCAILWSIHVECHVGEITGGPCTFAWIRIMQSWLLKYCNLTSNCTKCIDLQCSVITILNVYNWGHVLPFGWVGRVPMGQTSLLLHVYTNPSSQD